MIVPMAIMTISAITMVAEVIPRIKQNAYSSDKLTEYGVVMLVSSMTRAVIDGGIPAEDAYELSERILYKLPLAKGKQAYDQISAEAFSQFLSLVHRHRGIQTVSPHVRRCQAYSKRHLNEELSANILADHLGLSCDYLLHLFPPGNRRVHDGLYSQSPYGSSAENVEVS